MSVLLLFLLVTPCADPTRQVLPTSSNESGTYDVVLAANLRTYCARGETIPKYVQVLSDLFVQQSIIIPPKSSLFVPTPFPGSCAPKTTQTHALFSLLLHLGTFQLSISNLAYSEPGSPFPDCREGSTDRLSNSVMLPQYRSSPGLGGRGTPPYPLS